MSRKIQCHRDLLVYQKAFTAAMGIFELSKTFPKEERYSLTDQIRKSSRSVCSNVAEGWRKRRYEAAFVSKLKRLGRRGRGDAGVAGVCRGVQVRRSCEGERIARHIR